MTEQKYNFIPTVCEICGNDDLLGACLSEITLKAGYGSKNDGQELKLNVCGDCIDKLFNEILEERRNEADEQ